MSADTRQSASRNPSNGRQLSFACPLSVQPSMTSMRDHAKQSSASARGEIAPSAGPKGSNIGSISVQSRGRAPRSVTSCPMRPIVRKKVMYSKSESSVAATPKSAWLSALKTNRSGAS